MTIATVADAQRQPSFSGTICYSLDDMLEVIERASKPYSDDFKRYWDGMKAAGRCLFNLTDRGQNPAFHIEDTNVTEREYRMSGKTFHAIVVRGRIGQPGTGRIAYSFLQFGN